MVRVFKPRTPWDMLSYSAIKSKRKLGWGMILIWKICQKN